MADEHLPEIPFDVADWGGREVKEPLLADKTPEELEAAERRADELDDFRRDA